MSEQNLGEASAAFVLGPVVMGGQVRCSKCGREYTLSIMDDYYSATNNTDGDCERCMMRKAFAKPAPVVVSEEHAEKVCKIGNGAATCIFVMQSGGQWECAKGSDFERAIKTRRDDSHGMVAQGDNCSGPPDFTPLS
ncbi:MAG: hypothetical protein JWN50_682 [Parcubacteria group bacterium]|nr:hypothetical protein [Parcubacteria group bacterium]